MKIAQIAPLWESVPPQRYGGTERIVSYITEELVRQGHEVTLFASGDSVTAARLEAICPQALRLNTGIFNRDAPQVLLQERAFGSMADEFDLIHSHLDFLGFPLARRIRTPVVTTLHGRLDLPELQPIFREFAEIPLVSISDAQRRPLPWANWAGTVHHGLPDFYAPRFEPGQYLAFLGRIAPEKRPDQAIEVAKRVGIPLKIAAKVDPADEAYFRAEIEPMLRHPLIEFVGEITDDEKEEFVGNALALVCPYDWPEPFGIVFIESLACATPVLAYRRGSIPEIIDHGVTGFISETLDEMVASVASLDTIDRRRCRAAFDRRFTAERMVKDYLKIYEELVRENRFLSTTRSRTALSEPYPVLEP
ncbi:glycosyl transferase [Nitrospira sp.]|nr:glycosyl transferase [Nitrospira sp.]